MGPTAPANTAALNDVGGDRPELLWEGKRQVSDPSAQALFRAPQFITTTRSGIATDLVLRGQVT